MNKDKSKINNFKDLNAWQKSHEIVLDVYKITKDFPKEELYSLVSQMRRCRISITSNIAEGFSRRSYKEKIQFYSMAQGSLTELQNQLLISKDVGYVSEQKYNEMEEKLIIAHKIINGLIKKSKEYS